MPHCLTNSRNNPLFLLRQFMLPAMLLLASLAYAEPSGSISGRIVDQNNNPLFNVNVGLLGTRFGTTTDDHGNFKLEQLPLGVYQLAATMVGHEEFRQQVRIRPGINTQLHMMMPSKVYAIPHVNVIAEKKGIFETVPGSLTYINQAQIQQVNPVSGNEILRRSPGVHVVDEEGMGMRVNVGIRGLDPDRSRSVLILEDGIPVALAPYGEPEMYYTPAIDRMAGVEILKGSGSILYGPQTIGGVINYITADPPLQPSGNISLRGAKGGFFSGLFSYGNTSDKTGYQINFLHKQADSLGISNFRINDLSARLRLMSGEKSSLALKLGVYDETSNSTYVGITQTMYDAGGIYDFALVAPDDRLLIRRYSGSLIHNYFFNNSTRLTTTAYGYTTTRNWQRQDFSYNTYNANGMLNPPPANFTGVVWGDKSLPEGALYMRNSTGNRNRQFEVAGLESRLQTQFSLGGMSSELITGGRLLYERAFEQRVNGSHAKASTGSLMEDEIRTGYGSSAFVHNRLAVTQRLSLTMGMRMEHFDYQRNIRRGQFTIDGQQMLRDTMLVAGSSLTAFIPGAGFNVLAGGATTLFGGVHRGFAPPRVKDAISNSGQAYHLDAEKSWNSELGLRQNTSFGISWEFAAFYMDFSNQVIPVSESSGGVGAGLINGGKTFHRGVELAMVAEVSNWWNSKNYSITLEGSLTRVDARFGADRFLGTGANQVNIRGNKTPYAPEWTLSSCLVFEHKNGLSARFGMNYVDKQFADIRNTVEASANGRIGLIPAYTLLDGMLSWRMQRFNTTFYLSAKNLTNQRYIVTRRPQGIRLGMPRMITAGVNVGF